MLEGSLDCLVTAGSAQQRKIESAEWSSGDQIPSVTELVTTHGVSRATVAKAVRVLGG